METLQAEVREGRGKEPARQLRMQGMAPAVLYGPGGDPLALSVDPKELTRVLTGPRRRNVLIEISVGDSKELVMVKDLQVHPLTREIRHADFYRVATDRPVKADVPLRTKGRAKGVASGGKMLVMFRSVPVEAKPGEIPAEIMVDVTPLDQMESVTAKNLPLPEGVKVILPDDRICITIEAEKRKVADEEGEDEKKK